MHTKGIHYIEEAIAKGATAIFHEEKLASYQPNILYIQANNMPYCLSAVANAYYENPSTQLGIIGVSGTEGKSTTVYLIYQLLNLVGYKAGFVSTVSYDIGQGCKANPEHQTTPPSFTLLRMLSEMAAANCNFAVLEASSHGLSPRTSRVAHIAFDVGVITNIAHEHLEFHGSWEQYRNDKARLIQNLGTIKNKRLLVGRNSMISTTSGVGAVINADDPSASFLKALAPVPCLDYSLGAHPDAYLCVKNIGSASTVALKSFEPTTTAKQNVLIQERKTASECKEHLLRIGLPGEFNILNTLAALLASSCICGASIEELVPFVPQLQSLPGRMQQIDKGQPFTVIVDYAHTPSSFLAVLPGIRQQTKGKVICLFGSGGERDRIKRPLQAKVAAQWADILILADEDPRNEVPMAILEEIAKGCPTLHRGKELFLIPHRPEAIRKAFSLAKNGDCVVLLGKSHENSIIYADKVVAYNEIQEATTALTELLNSTSY